MAWTDGVDRAVQFIVTSTIWNSLLGATGSLMQLKSHRHDGTTGEGSQSLGALVQTDFTDAAAPAAPGAGKTRVFALTGGFAGLRSGAAGAARKIAETTVDGLDLAAHHGRHDSGGADAITAIAMAAVTGVISDTQHGTRTGPTDAHEYADITGLSSHAARHNAAGADAMTIDAAAATGSLRTLGLGAAQATPGDTFADHNARHEPGGADPMAVDAAAATGSLRTLGLGATQAMPGNTVTTDAAIVTAIAAALGGTGAGG